MLKEGEENATRRHSRMEKDLVSLAHGSMDSLELFFQYRREPALPSHRHSVNRASHSQLEQGLETVPVKKRVPLLEESTGSESAGGWLAKARDTGEIQQLLLVCSDV